jgi:signal transduction histidine kinase
MGDTLTLIHHEIKHNIEVHRNYGDISPIPCYMARLNQVFVNLLINSKHAIKGKGEITITTYEREGKVFIDFTDTGTGIPRNDLKRIFDPGFTTKGAGVGTGLGLSICYQIMQDHYGEILVESEVGKGTTFTLVIPIHLDEILGVS